MKKTAFLASLAASVIFSAYAGNFERNSTSDTHAVAIVAASPVKGRAYEVAVEKSELKWNAKKVTGEHYGSIKLKSGQLIVDKNKVTGGSFIINMGSVTCDDLKDEKSNGRLVNHLKSDDFFGVDKHPTATFHITSMTPVAKPAAGQPNYEVKGDLTIKGVTNPVSFPATISVKNGVATAKAEVTVDRTKYDIRYRSGSFFENLGDKVIYDDFTVSLNIIAQPVAIN